MSSSQLRALQAELTALRLRVEAQEERLQELEAERDQRAEGEAELERSFSLAEAADVRSVSLGSYSEVTEVVRAQDKGPVLASDIEGRLELARSCGKFLRRALAGDFRGSSGRDRLRVSSQIYVVAADYLGQAYNPPRVYSSFGEVRSLCKRGSSCGKAVFIGFASSWEAKEGVQAAGLVWAEKA